MKTMETKKQTAVEWLVEQLHPTISVRLSDTYIKELTNQAKAIEKQQIVETYNEGALDGLQLGEQYYNFVFKS